MKAAFLFAIIFINVFGQLLGNVAKGKWVKINEADYGSAEQLLQTTFIGTFGKFDRACSEADWELGNAYTKLNYEVGIPMATGRGYFAEILCPYTETEIYSIYAVWTSSVDDQQNLLVNSASIQMFANLNELGQVDAHLATLIGVETSLYDMGDILDFLINSYRNVVAYYSDVYEKVGSATLMAGTDGARSMYPGGAFVQPAPPAPGGVVAPAAPPAPGVAPPLGRESWSRESWTASKRK